MKASEFAATIVALSVTANARHLAYPEPTSIVALALDGVSPAPTTPPQLHEFFRRANQDDPKTVLVAPDATCGYISGRLGAPFVCDDTDRPCIFITPEGSRSGAIACCNEDGCATRASCVNYEEFYSSSKCDDGCAVDEFTLKCTETENPYCNTITFDGGIQDYWCNSKNFSSPLKAETTYNSQKSKVTYSKLVLTDPSSTFFGSTGTDKPAATVTNDADSDSKDDKEVNVGAIVGGVVGGVGAIGLAGILLWFILRQRGKRQPPNPPGYQPTLAQRLGGLGGYNQIPQGGAGYYDNKNPYALGGQQYPAYHTDPNAPYDPRLSYASPSPSPSYHQVPPPGQQLHPDQQLLAPGYQGPVIQEAGGKAIIPEVGGDPVIPEAGGKPVIAEAGGESVKPKAQELA
ncbi:hypothetical protein FSOLCH5_001306 [Fusarium solani]|uniref:Uncharacterized protein n=1 Tax=Fusarium solani TaxID=169388 RepID=A0A9P9L4J1_FUSSL|nr:uncharacterized protein B0J15DRAFT_110645 [Fusarium solani]KAH7273815.1 hypothetical protein B0J15DRAFT_110645 [Fusarium solani]KAJ3471208.1 hypothetical protein MRS44_001307 [Fusarium solani]KAJ4237340.1 hypothetical protein NW759_000454 [Fusarium solani]